MRGFPKLLKTNKDVSVAMSLDPNKTKRIVQKMLNEHRQWKISGKLSVADVGIADGTHKVVEVADDEGSIVEKYQYELREDPASALSRVGLSIQEAEDIVNG